jgi:hypothetical protein
MMYAQSYLTKGKKKPSKVKPVARKSAKNKRKKK